MRRPAVCAFATFTAPAPCSRPREPLPVSLPARAFVNTTAHSSGTSFRPDCAIDRSTSLRVSGDTPGYRPASRSASIACTPADLANRASLAGEFFTVCGGQFVQIEPVAEVTAQRLDPTPDAGWQSRRPFLTSTGIFRVQVWRRPSDRVSLLPFHLVRAADQRVTRCV